jgi:hypothetical protein
LEIYLLQRHPEQLSLTRTSNGYRRKMEGVARERQTQNENVCYLDLSKKSLNGNYFLLVLINEIRFEEACTMPFPSESYVRVGGI